MSELVVQLSEQISQFTELLKQISEADFDDGLNEAASGVLGKLLGNDKRQSLTALRFKVQDAKKKLKEVRPNKRKSTGTHGKKPKKPRLEESEPDNGSASQINFWDDSFVNDVMECRKKAAPAPEAFFKELMHRQAGSSEDDIACGILLVARGVQEPTAEQVTAWLDAHQEQEILARVLRDFQVHQVGKLSQDELATIYLATDPDQKGSFKERTRLDVYQNLMSSISAIQFAVGWQAHKKGAKQPIVEATFRKKMGLVEGEELDKDEFKTFCSQHRYYVRGANRLACAYTVFGSLVLLCPQLSFGYFRGTSMGANLSKAITKFESRLVLNEKQELGHRALVQMVIQSSKSLGLQQVFNHLEEALETFEAEDEDEESD